MPPKLAARLCGRGDGGGIAVLLGAAVRVAGIDDQAAHSAPRLAQVFARSDHGRCDNLIRGEHGGGRRRRIADENAQIEARALKAAMSGRESEAARECRTRTGAGSRLFLELREARVEILERGANCSGRRASGNAAARERGFERKHGAEIAAERRRKCVELGERHLADGFAFLFR